jgi:hypothetical protein
VCRLPRVAAERLANEVTGEDDARHDVLRLRRAR